MSTTEAEYMAIVEARKELLCVPWLNEAHQDKISLHSRTSEGTFSLKKILGAKNPIDMLTKFDDVSQDTLYRKSSSLAFDMTKESGDNSKKEVSTISTTQFQCPMLKPLNYSSWAIRMQIILEAKGLWEMIEPLDKTQSDNKKDKTAIAFLYQALPEEHCFK
ncbi:zinc finger, CCHC-type containing protein [Tanacetum coccineum]